MTLADLLKQATPGPWKLKDRGPAHDFDAAWLITDTGSFITKINEYPDATLIVTLVNLAPQLLTLWEVARELGDLWSDENENENWVPPMRMCLRLRAALNALENAK